VNVSTRVADAKFRYYCVPVSLGQWRETISLSRLDGM
jgi:hypothetical protein